MASRAVMVLVIASLIVGCGSDDSGTARTSTATPRATATAQAFTPTADATASAPGPIVGRWDVNRTCDGMVEALDAAGLRKLAPAVVNDYFPDQSPQQLARKPDVCAGAKPQQHSHFFTKDGQFGSVDQHNEQVDDAPYSLVGKHTLHLATGVFGVETYRYKIAGDELTLKPVISPRSKREALADPLDFGLAGHEAAVAYAGHTWKRAACSRWC